MNTHQISKKTMKTKIHIVAIFGLSIFTNVLYCQKYFVEGSFAIGALSSKKLNGKFVNVVDLNNFPLDTPEESEQSVSDTWYAIQGKFGLKLHKRLALGLHTSFTKHQFAFRSASYTKANETTYFSDHHVEISKFEIGSDISLAWKYLDLSLIVGVGINDQILIKGMTKSSEHFKILDFKNQTLGATINGFIGLGFYLKYPINEQNNIIGGFEVIEQLSNKVVKDYYQVSYTTVAFQLGIRYYFQS
jgi:hypothetical protein